MREPIDWSRILHGRKAWFKHGLLGAVILLAALGINHIWQDPKVILLVAEEGARWVRYPEPFRLNAYLPETRSAIFRYRFHIDQVPDEAVLTFRVLEQAVVHLNGRPLIQSPTVPLQWKRPNHLDMAPGLVAGDNELSIRVVKMNGPPAFWGHCISLNIRSGSAWEVSEDGRPWLWARDVDEITPFPVSRTFPRTDQALWALLPLFVPLFVLTFFWSLRTDRGAGWLAKVRLSAGAVRWLLLGGWFVMGANNFWRIPLPFGMDFPGHSQYISYVATYWRVPLATEGWQMFQPPLFYYLEALLLKLFLLFFEPETVIRILKLFPLLSGALQVEICYRALRCTFPRRESQQVIGTLVGGLIPMNLYMSQSIGNEPLVGCLTAMSILGACHILSGDTRTDQSIRVSITATGFILGLALLTKPTPILIIPPLLFSISMVLVRRSGTLGEAIRSVSGFTVLLLGTVFLTAGWYYIRNYIEMGRLFIGGWDSFREIVWWMDPGYRTPRQCYAFGEALVHPIFSAIQGFWDALYSTFWLDGNLSSLISGKDLPWNQNLMLSSAWFSLLPTAAMIAGASVVVLSREGRGEWPMLRFSLSCIIIYLCAMFYVFLTVPIFTSTKASYALGLIPCMALITAKGFEVLASHRIIRAALHGILACWAVGAYGAYFVL